MWIKCNNALINFANLVTVTPVAGKPEHYSMRTIDGLPFEVRMPDDVYEELCKRLERR